MTTVGDMNNITTISDLFRKCMNLNDTTVTHMYQIACIFQSAVNVSSS